MAEKKNKPKIAKKVRLDSSDILNCMTCGRYKAAKEFYISYNPKHESGYLPYCKTCLQSMCSDFDGTPNRTALIKLLRTIDRPFVQKSWEEALKTKNVIGNYFKAINASGKAKTTWADSDMDALNDKELNIKPATDAQTSGTVTTVQNFEDFVVTPEMVKLFGSGFTDEEYYRMQEKYEFLLSSYKEQTHMHTEALVTYVRYKVKEEIAIAQNRPADAKTWGDLAMRQAEKAKINPNQFSQSDLSGGMNTIGDIAKAVEEHQDFIRNLPEFKFRPNDAVDFCIWNYINYVRELEGKPLVDYKDVYEFYDRRKEEYIKSTGDPFGIFKDDPTEENRERVKTFIKLPEDYENSGEKE